MIVSPAGGRFKSLAAGAIWAAGVENCVRRACARANPLPELADPATAAVVPEFADPAAAAAVVVPVADDFELDPQPTKPSAVAARTATIFAV
jgi:hypothetical protein